MDNIKNIKLLVKEIQNLFFSSRYVLVIKETKKAIRKYPNVAIFYNMLGLALSTIGKFEDAELILKQGYKISPNDLAIINNLANVYKNTFNYERAEKLYKKSISVDKSYFNTYVNYGNLKRDLNKFREAIILYEIALGYNNDISATNYALSMAHQALGNFKETEFYAKRSLQINKKFTKSDLLISRSKKYKDNDEHLIEMLDKFNNAELNITEKINLCFALGKAYEDLQEMDSCFKFLSEGNKLKRNTINFDINFEKKNFNNIKKIFSKIDTKNFKNHKLSDKKIIFILGMPRSGTTLIEQIIGAHSKVYSSGELPYLTAIINKAFIKNETLFEDKINEILDDQNKISTLSDEYFSYLQNYNILEDNITDKAPLNFRWIGFIKILFPNSKIIHSVRDSKDNCVSLYKNHFEGNLNFCYSETELAKYYNLYKDIMNYWNKSLVDVCLEVNYENLVHNPRDEIKKIINYCELDWEENCLNYTTNKSPIKTASVGQARSSIYSSSLKSSSKYEPYLKELFNLL
ncbi:sulfotransferase [Candidatus Pelagibacter sp.]|nr:sulfotransferase [Candidatus Pelagibacter sp.]